MRCATHDDRTATWVCVQCERAACDDCIKEVPAGRRPIRACAACGGQVRATADTDRPPPEQPDALLQRVTSKDGLITAFGLALPLLLQPFIGIIAWLVYVPALIGFYFSTVDHLARGRPGLPAPSENLDSLGALVMQVVKGGAALAVVLVPLLGWMVASGREPGQLGQEPLMLAALGALGITVVPAAIVALTFDGRLGAALLPHVWAQIIARHPRSYWTLVARFGAVGVAWVTGTLGAAFVLGPIPWLGAFAVGAVNNLLATAQAVVVGAYLRENRDEFGF